MLRVTEQTMTMAAQRGLASSQARVAAAQQTVTSGLRITRPSDDPVGAAAALKTHADIAANAQYKRNIDNGTAWLNTLDSALGNATGFVRQARDLVIQGANGSVTQDGKNALADQVDALRKDLLGAANTRFMGRNVFAGSSDAAQTFTDGAPPTYNGTPEDTVQRRIGPDQTVQVDADGAKVFGTGAASVFGVLDRVSADLRAGNDPSKDLPALDTAMSALVGGRADVGTRLAQLERAGTENITAQTALEAQRSGIEDQDTGKAIMDLQLQQTSYQAALAVSAKTLQPTLMDFLK